MTKRKIRKSAVFITLILIILFGTGITFGIKKIFLDNSNQTTNSNKTQETKKPSNKKNNDDNKDQTYKVSLLATGDGLIHERVFQTYEQPNGSYDFSKAVNQVKDIVSKYDIAYYNQETPMGDNSINYSGYPTFYTPSEYGDAMRNIGFNTISLSSNHALDKGEKGVLNSVAYWKKTDALYHGMAASNEERENYIIKEKNNIKYTMLSYTEMTNGINIPSGKDYLINVYSKEKVKKDIEAVRDKVDVLIVAMHWGVEYQDKPNDKQKEMAEYLASLGVDIIIGNHPHVLQPITWIDNTLVMYSLGNFISNQYSSGDYSKLVSVLATVDITKKVNEKGSSIKLDNLGGELIFTHYDTLPRGEPYNDNHTVIPFSKMTDDSYLKDYKRIYEKYSKLLQSMGTNMNIAPLGA